MTLEPEAAVDLDAPPAAPVRRPVDRGWFVAVILALVVALLGGMLISRPAKSAHEWPRPEFEIDAVSNPGEVGTDPGAFLPTVTAWYADGTRGEAIQALYDPWRPDRPIRMLTVVAGVSCAISIDKHYVSLETASTNRVAVCVWTAPED